MELGTVTLDMSDLKKARDVLALVGAQKRQYLVRLWVDGEMLEGFRHEFAREGAMDSQA